MLVAASRRFYHLLQPAQTTQSLHPCSPHLCRRTTHCSCTERASPFAIFLSFFFFSMSFFSLLLFPYCCHRPSTSVSYRACHIISSSRLSRSSSLSPSATRCLHLASILPCTATCPTHIFRHPSSQSGADCHHLLVDVAVHPISPRATRAWMLSAWRRPLRL
ncbi:unnamed protein product [Periconia digitata]|uniref:Uncharacterized protein n=1 Tax=Periconia digitata TaxID=1303443 RepID=A0A9W4URG2_9PLEO|nr:unnamed protein product [Periconia digitata]